MDKLFLVTTLKNENLLEFQKTLDTSLISWVPVFLSKDESESEIIPAFKDKNFTVLGIESLELLKKKVRFVEEFEKDIQKTNNQ